MKHSKPGEPMTDDERAVFEEFTTRTREHIRNGGDPAQMAVPLADFERLIDACPPWARFCDGRRNDNNLRWVAYGMLIYVAGSSAIG